MSAIDDYLSKIDPVKKAELERIRSIVKKTAPETEEVISYGMPGFKYRGKYLLGYAAFRDHLSLFPTSQPVEMFKDQLVDYQLSKGTIQFTLERPLPEMLIRKIVLSRVKAINS